jgi:hypothetical protein
MKIMKLIEDAGVEPKIIEGTDVGITEETAPEEEQEDVKKEDSK